MDILHFTLITDKFGFGKLWLETHGISKDLFHVFQKDDFKHERYFQRLVDFHFSITKLHCSISDLSPAMITNQSNVPIFIFTEDKVVCLWLLQSRILLDGDYISISQSNEGRLFRFTYCQQLYISLNGFAYFLKDYFVGSQIARGGYAYVHLMWKVEMNNRIPTHDVLKIIHKMPNLTDEQSERVMREVNAMKQLNHPNIIKLIDFKNTADKLLIIMPYMSGGTLSTRITSYYPTPYISEENAKFFFAQLINGIDYMHKQKWMHRDSK